MFYVSVDLGFWLDKCFRQAKVRKASDSSRGALEQDRESRAHTLRSAERGK